MLKAQRLLFIAVFAPICSLRVRHFGAAKTDTPPFSLTSFSESTSPSSTLRTSPKISCISSRDLPAAWLAISLQQYQ